MTQVYRNTEEGQEDTTIKRLKKENVKDSTPPGTPVSYYYGPKKSEVPEEVSKKCVLPLKMLAQQIILVQRSNFHDFDFLRSVATKPSTPEFGAFNTKFARMQGQGLKPRTKATYTPLIDMTPSNLTTMKETNKESWSSNNLFTADLQLYRVGLNVQWGEEFIFRLGGMHFLMSYVGAVGVLMAGSGLEELMKAAFGGVTKMLTSKNFPQNTGALRIVAEQVLHQILCEVFTFDELCRN